MMMTPKGDDDDDNNHKVLLEEDCNTTGSSRNDNQSETDNSSPAGPNDDDNKDSSNICGDVGGSGGGGDEDTAHQIQSENCSSSKDEKSRYYANPRYIAYLDSVRYDDTAQIPSQDCSKKEKSQDYANPRYIAYLESVRRMSNNNSDDDNPLLPPPTDFEGMATLPPAPPPTSNNNDVVPADPLPQQQQQEEERPGAYARGLGTVVQRLSHVRFSLFGRVQHVVVDSGNVVLEGFNDEDEPDIEVHNHDNSTGSQPINRGSATTVAAAEVPTAATLANNNINDLSNSNGLSVATPIHDNLSVLMEAEQLDHDVLQRQEISESKRKNFKMIGCAIIAICSILLGLSLGLSLGRRKETSPPTTTPPSVVAPVPSPTRPLLPMENLELLYEELPEKTRENLYNSKSPQHQAWEWVLNHPNITTYPEWRKKQIFAMATFFYSFEGPSWLEETPARERWMDVTTSECSWVLSDTEVAFIAKESTKMFGDAYDLEDYRPCDEDGKLQTLLKHNLFMRVGPVVMPPEIGLLTSVRILSIGYSQKDGGKLSDILVPELIGLPNLLLLSFQGAGIRGTIPTSIGRMTQLKTLVLGGNDLSGSIPTEIGEMTSLELYSHDRSGLVGQLPTELGLMTQLTALSFGMNSHTGQIPSQIGLLTQIKELGLWDNKLNGSLPSQLGLLSTLSIFAVTSNSLSAEIPSELGLMTDMNKIWLGNNALGGNLPSQLGKMSHLVELWLGNDVSYTGPYVNFTGSFPVELWELSNLEQLYLHNLPNISGSLPAELFMPNLTKLSLSGSPQFSGTIPDQACLFIEELDFDCSDMLCGCDCPCNGSTNGTNSQG